MDNSGQLHAGLATFLAAGYLRVALPVVVPSEMARGHEWFSDRPRLSLCWVLAPRHNSWCCWNFVKKLTIF
ncbi:hypothetical protein M422DRAFT_23691 [Sphaerobolus stellatus SS14]|nr:hypothetical protein M422DRAFT_23671 [Sphaerobolus stellatus SS14]KIJ56413.1 hypothetical protein M422DRAFT_23691 [Sphaerobolus stellatus SS14]